MSTIFILRPQRGIRDRLELFRETAGRAVVYALAKQLNREWTAEDMTRAQSPESLSIAADDYVDALQNARRRMGRDLRTPRQEVVDTIQAA